MNQKKIGVIISYMAQLIYILSGMIYTPIMLRLLGKNEYGLYQLVSSVVSYLGLLSFGFGSSYMRFYSREKAKKNDKGVAQLNGMFLLIFCAISLVCIICGIIMIFNIRSIFGQGLTDREYKIGNILMMLMVFNLALSFPNSIFNCIITSQEKFLFQKTLILLQNLLNPFLSLPLLIAGYGSVGMVIVSTVLTIIVLIGNIVYCLKKLHAKFSFQNLKISLLKEMWIFTFFIFLNQIVDQINWSVDKFLLGRMEGTNSVAIYGVASQINNLYIQFSATVSNVFVPKVNRIVAETGDNGKLTQLFTRVGRIQFILMSMILTGFVFFGRPFIKFWAGTSYQEAYFIVLLLITPVTVPLIQNLGIEIQRAKNRHKTRAIVYLIIAIVNVFVSIPLIENFGPSGAALGTALSLVMGNVLFMNWYYHKRLGLNMMFFWGEIIRFLPAYIVPTMVGMICMRIKYDNIVTLSAGIVIYIIVFCISIYFLGMNKDEKMMVNAPIRKVLRR